MNRKNLKMVLVTAVVLALGFGLMYFSQDSPSDQNTTPLRYHVSIQLPETIISDSLFYSIDAGKGAKKAHLLTSTETSVEDIAYSAFVKLKIVFPNTPSKTIWIPTDQTSKVTIDEQLNTKLTNAFTSEDMGETAYQKYLNQHQAALQNFFKVNKNLIDKGGDSIKKVVSQEINKLLLAKLDYVKNHKEDYLAFTIFKNDLVKSSLPADQLENIYNTSFSDKIKSAWDAKQIENYFRGKKLKAGDQLPPMTLTDIGKNTIQLPTKSDPKVTMVHFWASWCPFCIAEMPNVQKLYADYGKNLDILSISQDVDSVRFAKAKEKFQMQWKHVYGDKNAMENFGFSALPGIILISQDGTILFKKEGIRGGDFIKINTLIQKAIKNV